MKTCYIVTLDFRFFSTNDSSKSLEEMKICNEELSVSDNELVGKKPMKPNSNTKKKIEEEIFVMLM